MLVANDDGDCALCCLRMLVDAMTPAECVECNAAVKLLADAETRNKLSFSNLQKTAEAAKNNETNSIPQFIVIDSDDEKVACIENENARQNNESCCVHVQNTAASSKWKHLLQPHEIALLVAFRRLSTAAQQLYSRLFVRKHVWRHSASIVASFRSFNIAAAVDECVAGGWLLQCASELDAAAVLHSLTLDQLKLLAKRLLLPASNGGKAHFLKAIVDHVTTPRKSHKVQAVLCFGSVTAATSSIRRTVKAICLLDAIALLEQEADIGPFLHIAHGETLVGLFKMLLPDAEPVNRNPKLISISSFLSPVILHALGRIKYAAYAVDTVDVLWRTRAHFDAFLLAQSMYYEVCEMETATQTAYFVEMRDSLETSWLASLQAADELCISSPEQQFLLRFTAAHYATKTMAVMAASLDRNKQYAEAASVYHAILKATIGKGKKTQFGGSKRGEWWLRLIILHARHLKDRLAACEVCELALADECVPAHKKMHFASRLQSMRAKEAPHDHAEKDKVNAPSPAFHTSNVEVCAIHAVAANAAAASKNRRSNNRVRLQNEHGAVYAVEQFAIQVSDCSVTLFLCRKEAFYYLLFYVCSILLTTAGQGFIVRAPFWRLSVCCCFGMQFLPTTFRLSFSRPFKRRLSIFGPGCLFSSDEAPCLKIACANWRRSTCR